MITGALKGQVGRVWDSFWSGGISNPVEVIEHIIYRCSSAGLEIDECFFRVAASVFVAAQRAAHLSAMQRSDGGDHGPLGGILARAM